METERWQKVDELLQSALDLPPGERAAYLRAACAGDDELRHRVESLVLSADEAASRFERPAFESAAGFFGDGLPALKSGQVLGDYEVVRRLGVGGMGEVYLARHRGHDRLAALKILPAHFAEDPQRMSRFQREARAVLALNHPNIVTVYDIGEEGGVPFIATEFVEGETLRERLARGPLEPGEATEVCAQVAAALAYAHERGVVHRDVKPENVMLRADSYIKVLDFGIAKLTDRGAATAAPGVSSEQATRLKADTTPGMVIGTPSYMSPEQARGTEVDERTDVWSLGVVLYEMLAGRAPFASRTASDTLALILQRNPAPLSGAAPGVPEELERVVSKALEKDRDERYQTARDMLADLRRFRKHYEQQIEFERSGSAAGAGPHAFPSGPLATRGATAFGAAAATDGGAGRHTTSAEYVVSRIKGHKWLAGAAAALALAALAGLGFGLYRLFERRQTTMTTRAPVAPLQSMRFTRLPAGEGQTMGASISPDGKFLARAVMEGNRRAIRLRQVSGTTEKEIVPLTEGVNAGAPVFSPDGDSLYYAFRRSDERVTHLYRVPVLGGDPLRLASEADGALTVSPDGKRIAFARDKPDGTSIVVAGTGGGGEETLLKRPPPNFIGALAWSPDGRAIAYVDSGVDAEGYFSNVSTVGVADRAPGVVSSARWRFISDISWLPDGSGLVLCARDRASLPDTPTQLWHVAYPGGEATRITNDLSFYVTLSLTSDSSAALVLQEKLVSQVWVAPGGDAARARQVTADGVNGFQGLAWTPGGRLLYTSDVSGNSEIWAADADGRGAKQLTFDKFAEQRPAASPDGRLIVFMTNRSVGWSVWVMNADGSGARELVRNTSQQAYPHFSPDSRWVYFLAPDDTGKSTLWKVPVEGGERVRVSDKYIWAVGSSPDGTLLAGLDLDTPPGSHQVRVLILQAEGGGVVRTLDAPRGTNWVQWSPDGKGLDFTVRGDDNMPSIWRQPLAAGAKPRRLMTWETGLIHDFAWSPDGKQLAAARGARAYDLVLIQNFR